MGWVMRCEMDWTGLDLDYRAGEYLVGMGMNDMGVM